MLGPALSTSSLTFQCRLLEGKSAVAPSFCLRLRRPPPCTSGLTLCEASGECWGSGVGQVKLVVAVGVHGWHRVRLGVAVGLHWKR